jgi:hypothetical protein
MLSHACNPAKLALEWFAESFQVRFAESFRVRVRGQAPEWVQVQAPEWVQVQAPEWVQVWDRGQETGVRALVPGCRGCKSWQ